MTHVSRACGCRRPIAALPVLLWALAGCHTAPVVDRPHAAREPAEPVVESPAPPPALSADELPPDNALDVPIETPEVPPCLPPEAAPALKRRSKPRPEPQAPAAPPAGAASTAPGANDAQVKALDSSVTTVLGRKVQGVKGEDLGRVVDVLADANGRVRVAVVEFGGFLGVGNRRIAVDWSLLRFDPDDQSKPLILSVDRKKLQSAPEYKNAPQPQELAAPQPSAAAATTPAPATPPPATPPATTPAPATPPPATPPPATPPATTPAPATPPPATPPPATTPAPAAPPPATTPPAAATSSAPVGKK